MLLLRYKILNFKNVLANVSHPAIILVDNIVSYEKKFNGLVKSESRPQFHNKIHDKLPSIGAIGLFLYLDLKEEFEIYGEYIPTWF